MPEISVIVPVYGVEPYLHRCLQSVIGQSFQNFELIVVNDGSPDNSQQVIDQFRCAHPDKLIGIEQQNAGVSAARNRAVALATGNYLVFVDGDDYIEKDYLQTLYQAAQRENADMVICGYQTVTAEGETLSCVRPSHYIPHQHEEWALRMMTIGMRIYRKAFWDKHHLEFETGVRGEDIPINLIANSLGRVATIPYDGYRYVQHQESAMRNLKGLSNYRLPYHSIEAAVRYVQQQGCVNSRLFFELSILRILTSFTFEFGVHSSKKAMDELIDFALHLLATYFPRFHRNPYLNPLRFKVFPFRQRWGVFAFAALCRLHSLRWCARMLAR